MRCAFLLIAIFLLAGCNDNNKKKTPSARPSENEMVDINQFLVLKDKERIQNYIERKKLNLIESPTGMWYQIIDKGEGKLFSDGDKILMEYDCSLLDGTACYSSKSTGPKELILGKSEMEAGMNEGLRLLKPGARAIFIFPPFLAYGLIGDRKKIPSRAVVVYNVNILQPAK